MNPTALFAATLFAHLPSISVDEHGTYDQAFALEDVDKSIVLYDVVRCEVPQVWLTFETAAPNSSVFVQLGVPVIDRLADDRPAIALLAPGLPDLDLPFAVPPGVGGVRFDAADAAEPGSFYEPFTKTSSWIWYEGLVEVPAAGQGWIVAWDPSGRSGKLWVAVGTVEDFSGGIDVTFEQIWTYHESEGYAPAREVVEQQCVVAPEGETEGEATGGGATGGEPTGGGETDGGDTGGGEAATTGGSTGEGETGEPGLGDDAGGCNCGVDPAGRGALAELVGAGLLVGTFRRRRRAGASGRRGAW